MIQCTFFNIIRCKNRETVVHPSDSTNVENAWKGSAYINGCNRTKSINTRRPI